MGKLSWSVDCDTVSIGTDGCAAILAALDRASSAVQAQLFLLLGQTLVPAKALVRGPGGKLRSVPQALAKQLSINKPTVETEWDAMISVFVDEGFSFLDRTGGEGKPSFDAIVMHELLHAFGLATEFGTHAESTESDDTLLTPGLETNGTAITGFAPPALFDSFLIEVDSGRSFASIWDTASDFSASGSDWLGEFAKANDSAIARMLHRLATTPDHLGFRTLDGRILIMDTPSPFVMGRSLSHLSMTKNPAEEGLLFPVSLVGPLPSAFLGANGSIKYSENQLAMLKTIGWTLCADQPGACRTGSGSSSDSFANPATEIPIWGMVVIVVGGLLICGGMVSGMLWWLKARKRTVEARKWDDHEVADGSSKSCDRDPKPFGDAKLVSLPSQSTLKKSSGAIPKYEPGGFILAADSRVASDATLAVSMASNEEFVAVNSTLSALGLQGSVGWEPRTRTKSAPTHREIFIPRSNEMWDSRARTRSEARVLSNGNRSPSDVVLKAPATPTSPTPSEFTLSLPNPTINLATHSNANFDANSEPSEAIQTDNSLFAAPNAEPSLESEFFGIFESLKIKHGWLRPLSGVSRNSWRLSRA